MDHLRFLFVFIIWSTSASCFIKPGDDVESLKALETQSSSVSTEYMDGETSFEVDQAEEQKPFAFLDIFEEGYSNREITRERYEEKWKEENLDKARMISIGKLIGLEPHSEFFSITQFPGWRDKTSSGWIETVYKQFPLLREEQKTDDFRRELTWYETQIFKNAISNNIQMKTLRRNFKIIQSSTWPDNQRTPIDTSHNWILHQYVEEWGSMNLRRKMMMKFGELLGIHQGGVQYITKESYEKLKTFSTKKKSAKIPDWFRTSYLVSLSTEEYKILDFNLSYADREPWWNERQMKTWQEREMPIEVLAKIGGLLKLGGPSMISPKEVKEVRTQVLGALKEFFETEEIDKDLTLSDVPRGTISTHLHDSTTTYGPGKPRTDYASGFESQYQNIKPTKEELEEIRKALKNNKLRTLESKDLSELFQMTLLMEGIPVESGLEYSEALNVIKQSTKKDLKEKGEAVLWATQKILHPPDFYASLRMHTLIENYFTKLMGKDFIESVRLKALMGPEYYRNKVRFSRKMKRVYESLIRLCRKKNSEPENRHPWGARTF
ncbi:hypothetical protein CROQUDRAFT_673965 [Cronartium quercuum f. sp. fusiforme G11]|uniref:Uncharacterized protein n=1 Tax=Cronartium quercuum f. sp. fusiforme G11 TaxID=708437 RepID=A0A9P6N9W7_9BASI|nr:hypothetical protein CROQUDRAFT_673965 [Cronartium quercuum f. sp. fusiforme G11]